MNIMKRSRFYPMALFLVISIGCIGQSKVDNGLWSTISLEKELPKKFSFSFDQEIRFKDNISRLDILYSNIGFDYSFLKGFKTGIYYRLTEKYTKENEFKFKHKFMFDIAYRYKISPISISYRSRIQSEVKDYNSEYETNLAWFWRNKFELKYSFKKFIPHVSAEFYYQIKDPWNSALNKGWHKQRFSFGLDYKLNKKNEFGLYYLIQRGIDVDDSNDINVIGIQYKLTLPYNKQ